MLVIIFFLRWRRTAILAVWASYDIKRSVSEKKNLYHERDFSRRFEFPQQLYGRESETAQLNSDLKEVMGGAKILVSRKSGYSGIGKTSLVNGIRRRFCWPVDYIFMVNLTSTTGMCRIMAFSRQSKQFCTMVLEPEEQNQKMEGRAFRNSGCVIQGF